MCAYRYLFQSIDHVTSAMHPEQFGVLHKDVSPEALGIIGPNDEPIANFLIRILATILHCVGHLMV